jgi:hypothetical protein
MGSWRKRLFERARRREVLKPSKSNRWRVRRSTCRQALATVRWTPSGTLPGTRSRVVAVNPSLMSPSVVAPDNQHLRTSSHTRRASYASRSVWAGGKFRREYVCVQTECQSFCGAPRRSAHEIGVDRNHKPVTIRECTRGEHVAISRVMCATKALGADPCPQTCTIRPTGASGSLTAIRRRRSDGIA